VALAVHRFRFLLSNGNSAVVIAATVVSFAPAIASYRLVESPIHAMRQLSRKHVGALITGFVDTWKKSINPAAAVRHQYNIQGCDRPVCPETGLPEACEWNSEATGQPIYLL